VKRLLALVLAVAVLPVGGAAAEDTASPVCTPRSAPIPEGAATFVSESVVNGTDGRLRTEVLDSPALGARTRVNVLLPKGYDPSGATRYPVLYLLHGALADYNDWNYSGGVKDLVDRVSAEQGLPPFIVVMPDGGHYGWYSDWYGTDIGSTGTAPAWSQHHVRELIPWIDATFPTVADRSARAIAGLSMGGFGAMSYAARYPDLFAAAGSFSGALNPTYGPGYGQAFVTLASVYFNDGHVAQCIWGDAATQAVRWKGNDPTYLASNLAATRLYVASGGGDADKPEGIPPAPADVTSPVGMIATPVEETCFLMSRAFVAALDAAGIAHTDDFYGSGTHEMKYWQADLRAFLPQMAAAWAVPQPPPAAFSYRSIAPRFSAWGWRFRTQREATEFTYLRDVRASGMTVIGSGRLHVVSPPRYTPGARYRVTQGADGRLVQAGAGGRLRFTLDLGPSHRRQQRRFDDAALDAWEHAVVTIRPAGGGAVRRPT
jgi:S-formylglutathione hydrolase FrmB